MRNEKTLLSFGQKGFTLVFDFPIYKNIFKVLSQIDDVVLEYKGKIYLTKDSRIIIITNSGVNKSGYKAFTFALKDADNLRSTGSMSTLRFSIESENTTAEYLPE